MINHKIMNEHSVAIDDLRQKSSALKSNADLLTPVAASALLGGLTSTMYEQLQKKSSPNRLIYFSIGSYVTSIAVAMLSLYDRFKAKNIDQDLEKISTLHPHHDSFSNYNAPPHANTSIINWEEKIRKAPQGADGIQK
jgi:hypothetical protein